jgi:hypothetical protein
MDSPFKRVANQPSFAIFITVIAWCLMIAEAFLWVIRA